MSSLASQQAERTECHRIFWLKTGNVSKKTQTSKLDNSTALRFAKWLVWSSVAFDVLLIGELNVGPCHVREFG